VRLDELILPQAMCEGIQSTDAHKHPRSTTQRAMLPDTVANTFRLDIPVWPGHGTILTFGVILPALSTADHRENLWSPRIQLFQLGHVFQNHVGILMECQQPSGVELLHATSCAVHEHSLLT